MVWPVYMNLIYRGPREQFLGLVFYKYAPLFPFLNVVCICEVGALLKGGVHTYFISVYWAAVQRNIF